MLIFRSLVLIYVHYLFNYLAQAFWKPSREFYTDCSLQIKPFEDKLSKPKFYDFNSKAWNTSEESL